MRQHELQEVVEAHEAEKRLRIAQWRKGLAGQGEGASVALQNRSYGFDRVSTCPVSGRYIAQKPQPLLGIDVGAVAFAIDVAADEFTVGCVVERVVPGLERGPRFCAQML